MDNVQRVQVGHSFQDLANHIAGVALWVVALVQDPIKNLSASCTTGKIPDIMYGAGALWTIYIYSFLIISLQKPIWNACHLEHTLTPFYI